MRSIKSYKRVGEQLVRLSVTHKTGAYYVNAVPVKIEKKDGYRMELYTPSDGISVYLEKGVKRFSQKRLQYHFDQDHTDIINAVIANQKTSV